MEAWSNSPGKKSVRLQDHAPSFGRLLSPRPSSCFILGSRKWYRQASRWLNRPTETRGRLPVAALRLLFSCPPPGLPRARLTRWNRTGLQTTRAPVRGLALWLILCSFNKLSALGRVLVQSRAAFVSSARLSTTFAPRRAATWGIMVWKWRQCTGSQVGLFHQWLYLIYQ